MLWPNHLQSGLFRSSSCLPPSCKKLKECVVCYECISHQHEFKYVHVNFSVIHQHLNSHKFISSKLYINFQKDHDRRVCNGKVNGCPGASYKKHMIPAISWPGQRNRKLVIEAMISTELIFDSHLTECGCMLKILTFGNIWNTSFVIYHFQVCIV